MPPTASGASSAAPHPVGSSEGTARARTSSSASSTRASRPRASASRIGRSCKNKLGNVVYQQVPIGPPPAGWAGTCQTGEQLDGVELQQQADRRPLLQRGHGRQRRHRCQPAVGVQLRRATTTATARTRPAPSGGNYGVPADRCGRRVRQGQRHGAARPRRDVQGPLVDAGLVDRERHRRRPARRDRRGRRRRRRRDQLLDQRHAEQLPRRCRDRVPERGRRGRLRLRLGRQRRARPSRRSRTRARGSRPSPPRRTTASAPARPRSTASRTPARRPAPARRRASWSRSARRPRRPASAS